MIWSKTLLCFAAIAEAYGTLLHTSTQCYVRRLRLCAEPNAVQRLKVMFTVNNEISSTPDNYYSKTSDNYPKLGSKILYLGGAKITWLRKIFKTSAT